MCLPIDCVMVGTRASARLVAVSKDQLNSPRPDMVDSEEREEGEEVPACRKCDELKAPQQLNGGPDAIKPGSPMSGYLVGFAKRVVICTILVFAFKSVWPQVQNHFWPEPPVKEGKCYVLNDKSFKGHVSRGDHIVMMYAPWCGHCQKLKPIWDKIAKQPGTQGVRVAKVDCTASTAVCGEFSIKGYPTILYFRNGKLLDNYSGAKSEPELKSYMARMKADLPAPEQPSMEDMMPPPPPRKKPAKKKTTKKKTEL